MPREPKKEEILLKRIFNTWETNLTVKAKKSLRKREAIIVQCRRAGSREYYQKGGSLYLLPARGVTSLGCLGSGGISRSLKLDKIPCRTRNRQIETYVRREG